MKKFEFTDNEIQWIITSLFYKLHEFEEDEEEFSSDYTIQYINEIKSLLNKLGMKVR